MRKRGAQASISAAIGAVVAASIAGSAPAGAGPPRLLGLRISNGGTPFAGDTPLLATVSPNGDGFRDRALIRFKLDRPASVEVRVVATDEVRRPVKTIWTTRQRLAAGPHTIGWKPARTTPDRTYLVRFLVEGRTGGRRVYGFEPPRRGRFTSGLVVRVQGIDAGFLARSYPVGGDATVAISTDARRIRLQLFSFATLPRPTVRDLRTGGVAVAPAVRLDLAAPRKRRHDSCRSATRACPRAASTSCASPRATAASATRRSSCGPARSASTGSRSSSRPTPGRPTTSSTQTATAGATAGTSSGATRAVDLRRPFLDFGVPFRFRDWDLSFISWLRRTGKQVDYLSDDDLAAHRAPATTLRRAYDLVVFPGHEEYVSEHVYDVVQRYRDLGGRPDVPLREQLLLEGAARGVSCSGACRCGAALGRPEAALVGAQWVGRATTARCRAPYVVQGAGSTPWAFAGTGLRNGSTFGRYGIEIDARAPSSPPGTRVLARIPDLIGTHDAEMTYYETGAGARVFAAGVVNFAASINDPAVSRLVENLWDRLTR